MIKELIVGVTEGIKIQEIKDLLGTEDVRPFDSKKLIEKAHQEAHMYNALQEVHDWIDWFEKELNSQK